MIRSRGGGGPLMDIGSHRIDLFLRWLGEPKNVQAMMSDSPDYEAEQTATVTMGFTGGAQAILQCYFGTVDTPDRVEVIGTDGRIIVEDLNQGDLSLRNAEGHSEQSYPPSDNLHGPLIQDFSAAVMANRSPAVDGRIGKQTNDIIEKAYKSAAAH